MSLFRRWLRSARFEQSLRFARYHFSHKATILHKSCRIVPTSDVTLRRTLHNAFWKYYQVKRFIVFCCVVKSVFSQKYAILKLLLHRMKGDV